MAWQYDPNKIGEALPEGLYAGVLMGGDEKVSKTDGNPYLLVHLDIEGVEDQNQARQVMFVDQSSRGNAKLMKVATAVGAENEFNAGKFDVDRYVGYRLGVYLKIDSKDPTKNFVFYVEPIQAKEGPQAVPRVRAVKRASNSTTPGQAPPPRGQTAWEAGGPPAANGAAVGQQRGNGRQQPVNQRPGPAPAARGQAPAPIEYGGIPNDDIPF